MAGWGAPGGPETLGMAAQYGKDSHTEQSNPAGVPAFGANENQNRTCKHGDGY